MRAPNGQSLPISTNKRLALATGGDVLHRCLYYIESAIDENSSVTFTLNEHDIFVLRQHYFDQGESTVEHLYCFLNEVFKHCHLPYRVQMVVISIKTLKAQCRIERCRI
jgi:hypothetical protein